MRSFLRWAFAACVFIGGAARADQTIEARLREALRVASEQVQSLQDERDKLKVESSAQAKELEDLRAQLASARKSVPQESVKRAVTGQFAAAVQAANEAANAATARLAATQSRCEEELRAAKQACDATREQAASRAAQEATKARACEENNAKTIETTRQFLDWLAGSSARICEPFLGLRRVEMENRAQDLQDRLLELKVAP